MNQINSRGFAINHYSRNLINNLKNMIKIWVKNLNGPFSKDDLQMVNEHMKRC